MSNKSGFVGWFVQLPDGTKNTITALVVWLFAALFAWVVGLIPFLAALGPYVQPLALAAAAAFIKWLESVLPGAFPEIAVSVVNLILLILAAFGVGSALVSQHVLPAFFAF